MFVHDDSVTRCTAQHGVGAAESRTCTRVRVCVLRGAAARVRSKRALEQSQHRVFSRGGSLCKFHTRKGCGGSVLIFDTGLSVP